MLAPLPLFPVNAGDRVRIWQIAQGLARQHEVTLVVPFGAQSETLPAYLAANSISYPENLHLVATVEPLNSRIHQLQSLLSHQPYHVALRYQSQTHRLVTKLVDSNDYSLIYCHLIHTLPYALKQGLPILLDQQNVDRIYWQRKLATQQHFWQRLIVQFNLAKTTCFEEKMFPALDGIVSVAEQDRNLMQSYAAARLSHFLVAPNGVDLQHYQPRQQQSLPQRQLTLGFLGSLELGLNQDAVLTLLQKIYPAVRQRLADRSVRLLVIGRQPPTWLTDWARQHQDSNIHVTGSVVDVLPYLHQVDLLVLPLQSGAGTKLRVLEAMAAGVCVIGTPFVLDGLEQVLAGQHAVVAHDIEAFVQSICDFVNNPDRYQQMTQQARLVAEERYGWQQITARLAAEIEKIYGESRAS